jgi:hypothetical protein
MNIQREVPDCPSNLARVNQIPLYGRKRISGVLPAERTLKIGELDDDDVSAWIAFYVLSRQGCRHVPNLLDRWTGRGRPRDSRTECDIGDAGTCSDRRDVCHG